MEVLLTLLFVLFVVSIIAAFVGFIFLIGWGIYTMIKSGRRN